MREKYSLSKSIDIKHLDHFSTYHSFLKLLSLLPFQHAPLLGLDFFLLDLDPLPLDPLPRLGVVVDGQSSFPQLFEMQH